MTEHDAFQMGYDAHDDGLKLTDCPKDLSFDLQGSWALGWQCARDALLDLEQDLAWERWDRDDLKDWDD